MYHKIMSCIGSMRFPGGKMRPSMLAALVAVSLSGCGTMTLPETNAVSKVSINKVIADLRYQVEAYQRMVYDQRGGSASARSAGRKTMPGCDGTVEIAITQITVKLSTTFTNTIGGSVGGSTVGAGPHVDVNFSSSRSVANSQQLSFPLYPVLLDKPALEDPRLEGRPKPIAQALFNLRDALQSTGAPGSCFNLYDSKQLGTDKGGRYTFGLIATRQSGGSFSLGISAIKLDASGTATSVNGNTVVVTFHQVPRRASDKTHQTGASPRKAKMPLQIQRQQLDQGFLLNPSLIDQ